MEAEEQQIEVPAGDGGDEVPAPAVEAAVEGGDAAQAQAPDQPGAQPPPAGMDVLARLANALEAIGG